MPASNGLPSSPARILIVDDERAIVDTLARYLAKTGLDFVTADNADEAERLTAADASICVVVSDISMPGDSGITLAERLQARQDDSRAIEVVIMTGFATTEAAIGAMRARVFDLVKKPFRLAEMGEVISRAMASSLGRRARASREAEIRDRTHAAEIGRRRLTDQLREAESGLRDTQTALERSERARAGMLSIVSHELRTPLIPIMGFSEVIAASPDMPVEDLRDYATLIHNAGGDLLKLIEVALDVVALQDGGGLGPRAGDWMAQMAGRVLATLARAAQARQVNLVQEGTADTPVYGDIQRIERALVQLLDNGIKASPAGATVLLRWAADGDSATRIEILDQGPGIPPEILGQIGAAFLQNDMSLQRAWPGAGLGLALAKRVADAHGGTLTLAVREGGGSQATVILPHHEVVRA